MNSSSISKSHVGAVPNEESLKLSSLERILLLLPVAYRRQGRL